MNAELTDAENRLMVEALYGKRAGPGIGQGPVFEAVARIKAAAVEQERAAWAARIEALADEWSGHRPDACPDETAGCIGCSLGYATRDLRALLTPDPTAALDAVKAEAGRAAGAARIEALGRLADQWACAPGGSAYRMAALEVRSILNETPEQVDVVCRLCGDPAYVNCLGEAEHRTGIGSHDAEPVGRHIHHHIMANAPSGLALIAAERQRQIGGTS